MNVPADPAVAAAIRSHPFGRTGASLALRSVEQGWMPDVMVRAGIRRLLRERLAEIGADDAAASAEESERFAAGMRASNVALVPELANAQHYEVPEEFFGLVLGRHRKYSSCLWSDGVDTLEAAEADALSVTCARAGLADGQRILELGCGWGSLSLWMAEAYPHSPITAVSNSVSQRHYIEARARERGLGNLQVITADMNRFEAPGRFERIVSVEMFEHMRNWPELFRRVSTWLEQDGRFFMHVFVHRSTPYAFVERGPGDWMSRHFFSGGMMPSDDLALRFQDHLRLCERWRWDGTHYQRTAEAWLGRMDANRTAILPVLARTHGAARADLWWNRWRVFFMACAELFGYRGGQEWWVSHYSFEPRA
jgi:cyclopropane-fatty-acyl-phospholipid synthase